jgi:hypothetical protein
MDTRVDEIIAKAPQHLRLHLTGGIDGGNQIRKNSVKLYVGHCKISVN